MSSSRPYLIRAMYDWIVDNNLTPHIVVNANFENAQVPQKYVVEGKIVLNISVTATQKLLMNNSAVEFDARFDNIIWHIYAPTEAILAIYARENGRGMVFEENDTDTGNAENKADTVPAKPKRTKPQLRIVK